MLTRATLPLAFIAAAYIAVRFDLAEQNLPDPREGPGFELLDTTRLGMTDRTFDVQYVCALQNELAKTIKDRTSFKNVNVKISIPKEAPFRENQVLPSASVRIITSRNISQQQVIAIQNLVAGAVSILEPPNVRVFDLSNKRLAGVTEKDEQNEATVGGNSHE